MDGDGLAYVCRCMPMSMLMVLRAGKRWRLREAGLWPLEPESAEGRFLTFSPPTPGPTPPALNATAARPNMTLWPGDPGPGWSVATALRFSPRLAAHMELVDRHIAALRNGLALARALDRQLILPRLLCLCERAQQPW